LRIGCVKYLNARPLIYGWPGGVTLDHPAALCRKLAIGELDVALVSSFEFLRNPIYKVVDGISISSDGPVYSVVVASSEGSSAEIELDPASQTSVALLQHLINARGEIFHGTKMRSDVLSPLDRGRARLLIGDQAIRFRQKFGAAYRYWDLGEEWKRLTRLPFVYALWLVRPEVAEPAALASRLRQVRAENLRNLEAIIAREQEFDPEFCRRYYTENLRFSFGELEKTGLQKFANACAKLDLIPESELQLDLV
jgi:predicted solute-binding protein